MHIDQLPDKALLHIFSQLSITDICLSACQTSHRWNALSHDPTLWQCLDLSDRSHRLTDDDLMNLLARAHQHVQKLVLRGCRLLTEHGFVHRKCICTRLRRLDVSCTLISNESLAELVSMYPALEELKCTDCPRLTTASDSFLQLNNLTVFHDPYEHCGCDIEPRTAGTEAVVLGAKADARVVRILAASRAMTEVRLASSTLDDMTLLQICGACRGHLRHLRLLNASWVVGSGLVDAVTSLADLVLLDLSGTDVSDATLAQFDRHCPNLRALSVGERVTDMGVAHVTGACSQLRELVVHRGEQTQSHFTDHGLRKVAANRPELRVLVMQCCPGVSDDGIRLLAASCHSLHHLDITGCEAVTSDGLTALADGCPRMCTLALASCPGVSGEGLSRLLAGCPLLRCLDVSRCDGLSRLNLLDVPGPFTPSRVINWRENPRAEPQNQPTLHAKKGILSLWSEDRTDESIIDEIVYSHAPVGLRGRPGRQYTRFTSPALARTSLRLCVGVGNRVVNQLARYCPGLRHVDLAGCPLIDDRAVDALARQCTLLSTVDISWEDAASQASLLTDSSLYTLAAHSKQLTELCIAQNRNFSIDALRHLIATCWLLTTLTLTASHRIPLNHLVQFVTRLRRRCHVDGVSDNTAIGDKIKGDYSMHFPMRRSLS